MAITSHALTGITQAGQSLDKWQAAEQAMRIRAFIRSLRFLPLLLTLCCALALPAVAQAGEK